MADGYIMAWYTGEKLAKLQVKMGETKYNYDLNNEGNAEVFPLQLGDGAYTIKVLEQTEGTMFLPIVTQEIEVTLKTEFEPFYARASILTIMPTASACRRPRNSR